MMKRKSVKPDEYGRALRSEGRSENTVRAYVNDVEHFLAWWSEGSTATTIEDAAAEYLNELRQTASASTVARRRSALRSYALWSSGVVILDRYRPPTPAQGEAHPLPNGPDDLRAILEAAWKRHEPMIALCGFAGARISEARVVRRRDLAQDDTGTWWVILKGKGSKDRRVPLPDEALSWLALDNFEHDDLLSRGISDRAAREAITKAAERAGISRPVSSHDLRMTFGTATYHASDLRSTQELLGHASPDTTARYTGVSERNKKEAVSGAFS